MSSISSMTTQEIQASFAEEISAAGGAVSDCFDDGSRLFVRSVLPRMRDVGPRDSVQAGVALRATLQEVWVHPYLFRQVCTNGAILAQTVHSCHIDPLRDLVPAQREQKIRQAVRGCCGEDAFSNGIHGMLQAQESGVDHLLNLMSLLSSLPSRMVTPVLGDILDRFSGEADRSSFGLMNAITSVARDTPDPEMRWRLEECGGAIAVAPVFSPVLTDSGAKVLALA